MKHYHHLMLGDEPHVKAVNPIPYPNEQDYGYDGSFSHDEYNNDIARYHAFNKANPPIRYYGPAFEGVKTEEEMDIFEEFLKSNKRSEVKPSEYTVWKAPQIRASKIDSPEKWRQAARLNEQPNRSQIPNSSKEQPEKDEAKILNLPSSRNNIYKSILSRTSCKSDINTINEKETQRNAIIEVMQADEKDGLYEEGLMDMKTTIELAEIAAEEDADSVTFYDTYKEGSEELTIYRNGRESGFMKGVGWLLNQLSSKR